MQQTVGHRSHHDGRRNNEQEPGIQRIAAGKQFAGGCLRHRDGPHSPQQHRRIQKPINRPQILERPDSSEQIPRALPLPPELADERREQAAEGDVEPEYRAPRPLLRTN